MHTVRTPRAAAALLTAFCLSFVAACIGGRGVAGPGGDAAGTAVNLRGAGASFPNPFYQKWLSEYGKAHPGVRIDYQSIGSGGGIKQIKEQTIDFDASDAPMKDAALWSEVKGRLKISALGLSGGQQQRLCIARAGRGGLRSC